MSSRDEPEYEEGRLLDTGQQGIPDALVTVEQSIEYEPGQHVIMYWTTESGVALTLRLPVGCSYPDYYSVINHATELVKVGVADATKKMSGWGGDEE